MTTAGANELFGGRCRTTQPRARDYYRSGPKRQRQLSLGVPGVDKKGPLATKRLPARLHNPAPRALSPQPSALRGDSQPGPVAVWDGCPDPATTTSPRPGAPDAPDNGLARSPHPRVDPATPCPAHLVPAPVAPCYAAGSRRPREPPAGARGCPRAPPQQLSATLRACGAPGLRPRSARCAPRASRAAFSRPPRPLLP